MKRLHVLAGSTLAATALLTTLLTGCSSTVLNQGGDTRCEDFLSAEEKSQNESITKMLEDEGKNQPANLELTATRLSIETFCQTVGTPDSPIKEAPHA